MALSGTDEVVVRRPLDSAAALAYLVLHAVPGVERVRLDDEPGAGTVERLVRAQDGPARLTVHLRPDELRLVASRPGPDLVAVAERWFGVGDDLADVVARLTADPDDPLASLVSARPHLRVPGHVDAFEAAAQTVLGQQVSLAAARTFTGRLAAALGEPHGDLTLFPDAARVAAADPDELRAALRVTHARSRTLVALARACVGGLDLRAGADPVATRAGLLAVPGIGPWTADYLALRALGDRDAFPAGDLVLRRALGVPDTRTAHTRARAWSPWRAYAAQHLWTSVAYARVTPAATTSPARRRRPATDRRSPRA
ncbi:AlkA N-terminal domain-containing protein [Cellulomonas sp.]|uniref:DNA-3-methyladenine glycosylase family protein n=1 Tax=Cellulomonas sp. TaxID=40001 RepID=UPI00258F328D|nr:AlkA N-terminal domain-containing protein [Cellulomonas sp.]MCR6690603.1 AlkA protein [Cellulomonas sp.]